MGDSDYEDYKQEIQNVFTALSTLETDVDDLKVAAVNANDTERANYYADISTKLDTLRVKLTDSLLEQGTLSTRLDSIIKQTLLAQQQVNNAYDGITVQHGTQLENQEKIKDDKKRMAMLNSYFSKSYDGKRLLMQNVVMYMVIIVVISVSSKYLGISESIKGSLIAIIIVYGALMTFRISWDMYRRTADDYDEIDWWWTPGAFDSLEEDFKNKDEEAEIVRGNNEYFATYSKF